MQQSPFAPRGNREAVEEGAALAPNFDADGLITAAVSDADSGILLMVAHMNAQALALTIETGIAHYWSRSRNRLWRKGEESGHEQRIAELRVDCDQDAVWLRVRTGATGANCHTGRVSCFYRAVPLGAAPGPDLRLENIDDERRFDPGAVYAGTVAKD
jgi:phosphoribosyl-AMP cyclohydrolase